MKPLPGVKFLFRTFINTLTLHGGAIHSCTKDVIGSFLWKKLRAFVFFLLFSGPFSPCLGQQVNFVKYTVQDGLVANPVRCM